MSAGQEEHAALIDAVLNLYTGSREDIADTLAEWYSADASFQDPLVWVKGRAAVEAQFIALKGMFVSASIQNLEVGNAAEDDISKPGASTSVIFSYVALYRPSRLLADKAVPIKQTTRLQLSADGLVEAHTDEWHNPLNLLTQLPGPLGWTYDVWRRVFGHSTSAAVRLAATVVDTVASPASCVGSLADKAFNRITTAELSAVGILEGLVDLRGLSTFKAAPQSFEGITAMFIGDLDSVSLKVAAHMVRDGAAALHLVSLSGQALEEAAEALRAQGADCKVIPHGIEFGSMDSVERWCSDFVKQAEDEDPIDLVVFGNVPPATAANGEEQPQVAPQAATGEAPERASEVHVLQALIQGVEPALAGRARVIVVASAMSQWLPKDSVGANGAWKAKAADQAARVQLAQKQGLTWSRDCEGLDCVSCTPGGVWANWSDALAAGLACTSGLAPVQLATKVIHHVPGWRPVLAAAQAVATSQAQRTLLQLCTKEEYVSPGAYYWGQHRMPLGREDAKKLAMLMNGRKEQGMLSPL